MSPQETLHLPCDCSTGNITVQLLGLHVCPGYDGACAWHIYTPVSMSNNNFCVLGTAGHHTALQRTRLELLHSMHPGNHWTGYQQILRSDHSSLCLHASGNWALSALIR